MDNNCFFCGFRCSRASSLLLNLLFSIQVYQNDIIGNTVTRVKIEKTQSLSYTVVDRSTFSGDVAELLCQQYKCSMNDMEEGSVYKPCQN